jgi:hypothetical protein
VTARSWQKHSAFENNASIVVPHLAPSSIRMPNPTLLGLLLIGFQNRAKLHQPWNAIQTISLLWHGELHRDFYFVQRPERLQSQRNLLRSIHLA